MKKARFKMMLVAAFAAFALLFGAKDASAQGMSFDVYAAPTGNFISAAEADILLTSQIGTLKNVLQTLTPGTTSYKTVERAVMYYGTIQSEVGSGKDIPSSIVTGLLYAGQDGSGYGAAGKTELMNLRTGAVDLLSQ
ncbi:MAG: hypothetical protein H6563_12715 [Lewinellaceae bacterium]|nr:hypothetical protein [Lewinellaceae bacterium]